MSLVFMNIDFSSLEVLEKINRIQILHDIAFDLRENFVLPENEKIKSDSLISNDVPVYYPSIEECKTVLDKASKDAEQMCKTLKMKKIEECNPEMYLNPFVSRPNNQQTFHEVSTAEIITIKNMIFLWLLVDEKFRVRIGLCGFEVEGRKLLLNE